MINTNTKGHINCLKASLSGLALLGAVCISAQAKDGPTLDNLTDGGDTDYFIEIQQVFAKPDMENARAFNAEIGPPRDIDFNYDAESSSRLIFGFIKPTTGVGFRARYWSFEGDSSPLAGSDTNGLIATDAISIIAGGGIDDVDTLSVTHTIDADVLDLETITRHQDHDLLTSLGVRVTQFGQEYNLSSDEGGLNSQLDFIGLGPTASIEGTYQLGQSDFSLFGNARVSLLVGQRELDSNNVDTVNGGVPTISDDDIEIVYNADVQAGVEWRPARFQDVGFFTRAGLEYQYWGNVGNLRDISSPAIDDTIPGGTTSGNSDYDGDIDFIGFFLSAGFSF